MTYRKPLRGGGHRIIGRTGNGRFARLTLGAEICVHCRAFILPEYPRDEHGFVSKRWPEVCHQCLSAWNVPCDGPGPGCSHCDHREGQEPNP